MNRSVFRAALRASAKVALGAAVVGCGGVVGSAAEHASPEASASDVSAAPDASPAEAASQEAGACDPPPPSTVLPEGAHADAAAAIGASTFDCCVALLEAVPPDDGGLRFPDAAAAEPRVQDCCATVIARLDYELRQTIGDPDAAAVEQQDEQAAAPVRWACCEAIPSEGPTCTPWGPPMPPAMPGDVA